MADGKPDVDETAAAPERPGVVPVTTITRPFWSERTRPRIFRSDSGVCA